MNIREPVQYTMPQQDGRAVQEALDRFAQKYLPSNNVTYIS